MKTLTIFLFSLFLTSCAVIKKPQYVRVTGEARNFKAGAAVISNEDHRAYFLDYIVSWDDNISSWTEGGPHRQVMVSGYLEITKQKKRPGTQQMLGVKRTILNPKWEVISKDSISN